MYSAHFSLQSVRVLVFARATNPPLWESESRPRTLLESDGHRLGAVYTVHCTAHSIQCRGYTVHSVQGTAYSVQCTVPGTGYSTALGGYCDQ